MTEYQTIPSQICRMEESLPAEELIARPLRKQKLTKDEIEDILKDVIVDAPPGDPTDCKVILDDDDLAAAALQREEMRRIAVLPYRNNRYFGPGREIRYCIWFDDNVGIQSLPDFSKFTSGVTWICVKGKNSKCALTWSGDVPPDTGSQLAARTVLTMALLDMKELDELHQGRPCAVVSVADENFSVCGIQKALAFLEGKLKGRSSLSDEEVVEIAVDALKALYGSKVKNSEIRALGAEISRIGRILKSMGVQPVI